MKCFYPQTIILDKKNDATIAVPCGRCIPCKIRRSREWALRLVHELDSWDCACFLTLTYSDEFLPLNSSLEKKELSDYIKRVRATLKRKLKYYGCGEYGSEIYTERPHYHVILFGADINDIDVLRSSWYFGHVDIGSVTYDSCRYVAGYIEKKYNSDLADDVYFKRNRIPPFQVQSQGIGKEWMLKNEDSIRENLYIGYKGIQYSVPRYYVKKLGLPTEMFDDIRMDSLQKFENILDDKMSLKYGDKMDVKSRINLCNKYLKSVAKRNEMDVKAKISMFDSRKKI